MSLYDNIYYEKIFYSLLTGLAASLAVYIAMRLHLSAPYWSAISVVAICSPGVGNTINKGLMRIIATFLGAALGLYLASVTINNFYAYVISCFLVFTLCQYLTYCTHYKYVFVLCAATFFMVNASAVNDIGDIYFIAIWRFTEVSIGVVVATLLMVFSFNKNTRSLIEDENILFLAKGRNKVEQQKGFIWRKESIVFKESIKNGLAVVLSLLLWMFIASPGGLQGLVSVLAIGQPQKEGHNVSTVMAQARNRFLGCFVGGIAGLVCLYFLQFNVEVLLTTLFLGISLFAYFMLTSKNHSYMGLQANMAFILTIAQTDTVSTSIIPAMTRLSGILLGIFCIMVVHLLVWPVYKKDNQLSAL